MHIVVPSRHLNSNALLTSQVSIGEGLFFFIRRPILIAILCCSVYKREISGHKKGLCFISYNLSIESERRLRAAEKPKLVFFYILMILNKV